MFNQFVSVIGCYDDLYKYYAAALQRAPRRAPVADARLTAYSLLDANTGKASTKQGMNPSAGYEMGLPSLEEFHKPTDFKKYLDIYDPKDHKKFIFKFAEDLEKKLDPVQVDEVVEKPQEGTILAESEADAESTKMMITDVNSQEI